MMGQNWPDAMDMLNEIAGSYIFERPLGPFDDGGTGSDMRRFVTWNNRDRQYERYHYRQDAKDRADELNKEGRAK